MGLAMWSTFISIFFTVFGFCAFDRRTGSVKTAYWSWMRVKDTDTNEKYTVHFGLRSLVYTTTPCTVDGCTETQYHYYPEPVWPTDFMATEITMCTNLAVKEAYGLGLTCVTLVFALIGTINRMKFSSDANVQKALGMITDACGFVSLAYVLAQFEFHCIQSIPLKIDNLEISVTHGPGYWAYCVCLFGAFMRAVFHWATPTPKCGSEGCCTCDVPDHLAHILDTDGDGKMSFEVCPPQI